jgi:hypothetical protein
MSNPQQNTIELNLPADLCSNIFKKIMQAVGGGESIDIDMDSIMNLGKAMGMDMDVGMACINALLKDSAVSPEEPVNMNVKLNVDLKDKVAAAPEPVVLMEPFIEQPVIEKPIVENNVSQPEPEPEPVPVIDTPQRKHVEFMIVEQNVVKPNVIRPNVIGPNVIGSRPQYNNPIKVNKQSQVKKQAPAQLVVRPRQQARPALVGLRLGQGLGQQEKQQHGQGQKMLINQQQPLGGRRAVVNMNLQKM